MDAAILLLVVGCLVVLGTAFRIAGEYQRFAVFVLGRFVGLKGPGLLLRFPGGAAKWTRLSVGDVGELIAPEVGRFAGVDLPVASADRLPSGTPVQIVGFNADKLEVQAGPVRTRILRCENCGHEMTV